MASLIEDVEETPAPRAGRRGLGWRRPAWTRRTRTFGWFPNVVPVAVASLVVGLGALLRLVDIGALGYNSDEAVYAGQAASLAGNPLYTDTFPVFRAHPLLFQSLLSLVFRSGEPDAAGRVLVAGIGMTTLLVVYLLGKELYGRREGAIAALLVAVMPYHVLVTRQVLLDGPMTLLTTLVLLLLAKYARTHRVVWFVAAGAAMGLAMLAKETSIVLLGAIYAFLALTPHIRGQVRGALLAVPALVLVFATHPISMAVAGHSSTGKAYLVWQLLRRPNHSWTFYAETVPLAIGPLVLIAAAAVWLRRTDRSWREVLLLCWIIFPVLAFELWPVKGFQYLLPAVPPLAVLAARGLTRLPLPGRLQARAPSWRLAAVGVVTLSLLIPCWQRVRATDATTFLAGSGGVPGGRETGRWIADNTPTGSEFLTLGPSMANIVQFYGHRRAYGLSVSPNPLHRNPSYTPIINPDRAIRQNNMQYVVWDAFSANRSPFFANQQMRLVRRYHGLAVHTETVPRRTGDGTVTRVPVTIVYQVRP